MSRQWTQGSDPSKAGCDYVKNIGNWCQTVPYVDDNGAPASETLFVATNCNDRWPISFCWQDPVYLLPGISNNATVYSDYVIAHED
ncbi:hypothetical protein OEA41_009741 [Lepraria neglecta]|uniref:Uncharacterized protein n=1 Tax=Lepraria neglecta TaxID=209136 RepID=A0AAD9Z294_9LECA|nr:hypothetical protein OEA41_009741 [Lepraria neglecta]